MPSLTIHLEISLWWLIAYLILGFIIGSVFMFWIMKTQSRSLRSFGLSRIAKSLGLWTIGWPVCAGLVIYDESSSFNSRRNRKKRKARADEDEW